MVMRHLAIVLVLLAGCASLTTDQEMAVSCRAYAATLNILTPLKPRMSATQISSVDTAIAFAGPACRDAAAGKTSAELLTGIRAQLRTMLTVEKELKP